MLIDEKIERELIDRKITLECFQITLTQKSKLDALRFSGPGCIYYDKQGDLRIKLYDRTKKSSNGKMLRLFFSAKAGIVPEEDYFRLRAKDEKGNIWTAGRIHLNDSYNTTPFGTVFDIKLETLTCTRKNRQKIEDYHGTVVIRGNRQLPFNKFIDNNGSSSLRGLQFDLSTMSVDIEQRQDSIRIFFRSNKRKITTHIIQSFLDAFSIASGEKTEVIYFQTTHSNKTFTAVYNFRETGISKLPSLTSMQYHEPQQLQGFIDAFMSCPNGLTTNLLTYWRRLTESSKYSETAALVLCTNIEGMIKQHVPKEESANNQLATIIKETKKAIKTLRLNDKIHARIMQTVSDLDKKGVGARLRDMQASGSISPAQVTAWIELRNSTAHADLLGSEGTEIINFYNNQTLCIELFYYLIGRAIKYAGARNEITKRLLPFPENE